MELAMAALLGGGMGYLIRQLQDVKGRVMALSDEVKAFAEGVIAKVDVAVADIQALHAKLEEALQAGDVEGARAAIAAANAKLEALQAAVDLPE